MVNALSEGNLRVTKTRRWTINDLMTRNIAYKQGDSFEIEFSLLLINYLKKTILRNNI